jgi:hypothetical protein
MGRFETEWLSRPENLAAVAALPGRWIDKVHQRRPTKTIELDMVSSESPTDGEQEGSAYSGYFGCTFEHPLFVFNQLSDVERCVLRPGNATALIAGGRCWSRWSSATMDREAPVLSRRRGLCQSGDLRIP